MTDLRIIARCALMLAAAAASIATMAQVPPSAAASAAAEKAQKETDRTMYWIRVLATSPSPKAAAAPKPVAAAPAPAPKVAATPERVKVAAAPAPGAAPALSSADIANATPGSVIVPAPGAASPSLAAATGTGHTGHATAMSAGGLDAGLSSAGAAGGLAAPGVSAPQVDIPSVEDEPDPGLIMVKSADPEFPMATMRRLRKGEVEVKFEVGPDGVVDVVTVMKTSSQSLNAAAIAAVKQWRFKPTPRGHTAMVDLAFNLDA